MQTNHHHHHTYESPKQYYSTELSYTFFNDNIVGHTAVVEPQAAIKEMRQCLGLWMLTGSMKELI